MLKVDTEHNTPEQKECYRGLRKKKLQDQKDLILWNHISISLCIQFLAKQTKGFEVGSILLPIGWQDNIAIILLAVVPIYSIMASLETSEEDQDNLREFKSPTRKLKRFKYGTKWHLSNCSLLSQPAHQQVLSRRTHENTFQFRDTYLLYIESQ